MSNRWHHFRYSFNRRAVVFQGVNLWSFNWQPVGINAEMRLPGTETTIEVPIYEIRHRGRSLFFAAHEILPNYWIFAAKDDPFDSEGCAVEPSPEPPQRSNYSNLPECLNEFL